MKTPQRNGGNIRRDRPTKSEAFEPGDIVALTPSAIKEPRLRTMGPRILYDVGWRNEFLVLETFQTEQDGDCVVLDPCCGQILADRATDRTRCINGHPASFFKKVGTLNQPLHPEEGEEADRPRNKGDRSSSASFPWLGEVAAFSYEDHPEIPKLKIKIAGKTTMLTGPIAKMIAEVAKANNLL